MKIINKYLWVEDETVYYVFNEWALQVWVYVHCSWAESQNKMEYYDSRHLLIWLSMLFLFNFETKILIM